MSTNYYLTQFMGDRFLVVDKQTGRTVEVHRSLRESRIAVLRLTAAKVQGIETEEDYSERNDS